MRAAQHHISPRRFTFMILNLPAPFHSVYRCHPTIIAYSPQHQLVQRNTVQMQLHLLLSSLALVATVASSPAPTRALDTRQSVPTLIGTCTVATNLCLAPYPWTPPTYGNFTCGRWSNVLGTVINNPAKFCLVDGHVSYLIFTVASLCVPGRFADLLLMSACRSPAKSFGVPSQPSAQIVVVLRITPVDGEGVTVTGGRLGWMHWRNWMGYEMSPGETKMSLS